MIFASYEQLISERGNITTQGDPPIQIIAAYDWRLTLCFYFEFEYRKSCTVKMDTNDKLKGIMCSLLIIHKNNKAPSQTKPKKEPNSYSFWSSRSRRSAEVPRLSTKLLHLTCTVWKVGRGIYTLSPSSPTIACSTHQILDKPPSLHWRLPQPLPWVLGDIPRQLGLRSGLES